MANRYPYEKCEKMFALMQMMCQYGASICELKDAKLELTIDKRKIKLVAVSNPFIVDIPNVLPVDTDKGPERLDINAIRIDTLEKIVKAVWDRICDDGTAYEDYIKTSAIEFSQLLKN